MAPRPIFCPRRILIVWTTIATFVASVHSSSVLNAEILVTGFFTGTVEKFNEQTYAQSTFATIAGNPGLTGIVYNPTNNRVYVSALNHGGIYVLDATTGAMTGFHLLGFGPAGLAVDTTGNVVVTDFISDLVRTYDPTFSSPPATFSVPSGVTSGVGLLSNGNYVAATAGSGVYRYDGVNVTPFTTDPMAFLASSQVAVDSSDNVFVGHGLGFSDFAMCFDSSGNVTGMMEVTDAMVSGTGQGSATGTSPSGTAVDRDGNVIVAALGRSNPGDPGGERGGVFKFSPAGALLDTIASGTAAFSAVTIVPDAQVEQAFVYHNGWSGGGSPEDSGKTLHLETTTPTTLSYDNLINSSKGINAVGFRIKDLKDPAGLNATDFDFQMSPLGAFDPGTNPPSGWTSVPNPTSIVVTSGSPDEVLLIWPDNDIANRWLRITIKATGNTGLATDQVYYVGHLRGECSGVSGGVYTVAFEDIQLIRNEVGNTVGSNSIHDINKDGTVSFADITEMRASVGSQLSNISVP